MADEVNAGKITFDFTADLTDLHKAFADAKQSLNSLSSGMKQGTEGMSILGQVGTIAAGIIGADLVTAAFDAAKAVVAFGANAAIAAGRAAERFEQLSQRTGIAVDALQGLQVAMARQGLEAGALAQGFRTLSGHMVGMAQNSARSIELFRAMGISAETVGKGTGVLLGAIADKFASMADGAEKSRLAIELFGRSGLQLIPILNQGSAGLEQAMQKAEEFGLILTKTQQSDLTTFDDAMDDLDSAMKGFTTQVGAAFAPSLTALIHAMTDAVVFAKNVFNLFADAAEKLTIRAAALVTTFQLIGNQLLSFSVLSKEAWADTFKQVEAIDAWAAIQIKAVDETRQANQSLSENAQAHLNAAQSVQTHTDHQKILGEQIVATTKIQLSQIEIGKRQQERLGQGILDTAKISFSMAQEEAEKWIRAYNLIEDASMERFKSELDSYGKNQEALGRYIVANTQAAYQVRTWWVTQLEAIVASNTFSISTIITTWTGGLANAIVNGGNFVKQAWNSTQIALIQGALNTTVQLMAEWGLRAAAEMGFATSTASSVLAINAAKNSAIIAGEAGTASTTTSIWAGATAAATGMFATFSAAISAIFASLVGVVTTVGTAIMGVLSAIAEALTATVFGIPWAGAILVGIALIAASLAALGAIKFAKGGIVSGPTLGLMGEAGSPEAAIPLNERGAKFMSSVMGMGGGGDKTQVISINIDGVAWRRWLLQGIPDEVRLRAGAIA